MEKMTAKEKVTMGCSILALALSLTAFINTLIDSSAEQQRTFRSQLTVVLGEIMSLGKENAQLFKEYGKSDPAYYNQVSSILNQQNAFLLQQAMYIADKLVDMTTSIELNTIALSNASAGDLLLAEKYYLRAIEAAQSDYYKSLAIRSYAGFLFPQRRFEEARDQFRAAVALLKGGDNLVRLTNGLTYQMWAYNEIQIGTSLPIIEDLKLKAKSEFQGIDNIFARENAIRGLNALNQAVDTSSMQP